MRYFEILNEIIQRERIGAIGPEIRQYLVAHNREELPFNRSEREWIYNSAERKNNYFGFGTDDQIYSYPVALQWIADDWRIVLPTAEENIDAQIAAFES